MTSEALTLWKSWSAPCLKKGSHAGVYVNTRSYTARIWQDKQCMPSNFHEYNLPIRERKQNLQAEAGGWQEGAQGEDKAGQESLDTGSLAKGAVVVFRGETWSLGSLYRGNREVETYLLGRRWRWMTRLFSRAEGRDTILFGDPSVWRSKVNCSVKQPWEVQTLSSCFFVPNQTQCGSWTAELLPKHLRSHFCGRRERALQGPVQTILALQS